MLPTPDAVLLDSRDFGHTHYPQHFKDGKRITEKTIAGVAGMLWGMAPQTTEVG